MICNAREAQPVIKFKGNNSKTIVSNDGMPITVFLDTIYNQDEYTPTIITNLEVIKVSFYEYLIIPSLTGNNTVELNIQSNDGEINSNSTSLVINILVKKLRTADDNVYTMDSDVITSDGFIQ